MRRAAQVAVLLLVAVTASHGLVRAYSVEPVSALLSGKVWGQRPYGGVSEILTCCWDQLDSASGGYVELFQGDTIGQSSYLLDIYEYPNGDKVAGNPGRPQGRPSSWLKFKVYMEPGMSFAKGKQYEFKFTRGGSGSDSIMYYWRENQNGSSSQSPYPYGFLKVNGQGDSAKDLCCRVYSRLNPVDSLLCGMDDEGPPWRDEESALRPLWVDAAQEAGVGAVRRYVWWQDVQKVDTEPYWFEGLDTALVHMMKETHNEEVLLCLCGCPKWASTRITWDGTNYRYDTCVYCAPRNLWVPWPSIVPEDINYWARYLDTLVRNMDALGCTVHNFEVWNESKDFGDTILNSFTLTSSSLL